MKILKGIRTLTDKQISNLEIGWDYEKMGKMSHDERQKYLKLKSKETDNYTEEDYNAIYKMHKNNPKMHEMTREEILQAVKNQLTDEEFSLIKYFKNTSSCQTFVLQIGFDSSEDRKKIYNAMGISEHGTHVARIPPRVKDIFWLTFSEYSFPEYTLRQKEKEMIGFGHNFNIEKLRLVVKNRLLYQEKIKNKKEIN